MENLQKTQLDFKLVFNLPNNEAKKVLKEVTKPDLQGIIIKDNKLYVTNARYAYSKPFQHNDTFVSFADGKEQELNENQKGLTTQIDKMFSEHKSKAEVILSVEQLSRVLAIAKENSELNIKISVPIENTTPIVITQKDTKYLLMPIHE